jgi:hypothetical protein
MKKLITGILTILTFGVTAQNVPQGINYQAIARDNTGAEITGTGITVRYSIGSSTVNNTTFNYQETHSVSTNQFGLFNTVIGQGTPSVLSPAFNVIGWNIPQYLLVEIDFGSGYEQMGIATPFVTVPYSFLAKEVINKELPPSATINDVLVWNGTNWAPAAPGSTSETTTTITDNLDGTFTYMNESGATVTFDANIDDADASITNEIQDLNLTGNTLTITNNGSASPIDLSIYNELPTATLSGQTVVWNGSDWTAVMPSDPSATNEIQNINVSGNNINISGGTGTTISSIAPSSPGQVLTWNGTSWIAQNPGSGADNWGSQVVISDATLSGNGSAGSPLSGFDGDYGSLTNTPTIPTNTSDLTNDSGFLTTEVDGSTSNEIQTLSISSNTLTISGVGGNSITLPSVTDTDNQTIDVFQLNSNSLDLSLEDDGMATQSVDLSPIADKTVVITGTGATTVSGTYPNFTINSTDNNTTYAAGAGININGSNVIENTAPDQIVSLTGASGITVAGTYPNFTLTNSAAADTDWTQGTGVTYNTTDNIGIGTSTTSSKLEVSSSSFNLLQLTTTGANSNVNIGIATTGSGGAQFSTSGGTGGFTFYTPGGGIIPTVSIADNSRVGIALNSAPLSTLDVDGQVTMRTGATAGYIPVSDANGTMTWTDPASINDGDWTKSGLNIYNLTDNVGIGTNIPGEKLSVNDGNIGIFRGDGQDPLVHISGDINGIGWSMGVEDSDAAYFKIAASSSLAINTKLTITDNGEVGIGQSNPQFKFQVDDAVTRRAGYFNNTLSTANIANNEIMGLYGGAHGTGASDKIGGYFETSSGTGVNYGVYANSFGGSTNWAGYFNTGNVFIQNKLGINTTALGGYQMRVNNTSEVRGLHVTTATTNNTAYGAYFENNHQGSAYGYGSYSSSFGSGTGTKVGSYGRAYSTSGGDPKYGVFGYAGGSGTLYAGYFSGNVYCTGSYLPSDRSLKQEIQDVNTVLEDLMALEIKQYEYKQNGVYGEMNLPQGKQIGFIADNIGSVYPSLIKETYYESGINKIDSTEEDITIKFNAVNYSGMVPVIAKATQEQQILITEMQQQIEELKKEIEALKSSNK